MQNGEKNNLLSLLLPSLAHHRIAERWSESKTPYSDLERECVDIGTDSEFALKFRHYFDLNPIIYLSVHSLLAHITVAANFKVEHVSGVQQILVPTGIRIARWLPTFLLISGPLGTFLRSKQSPMHELLTKNYEKYPNLVEARKSFNHDLFRCVRNGLGHWAFDLRNDERGDRLVCFDEKTSKQTVDISFFEVEALHMLSFSVVECLDKNIINIHANPSKF